MISQLNVAFIRKLWVIAVFGLFGWHGCLYNQAVADVRMTDAGIKCLFCTIICSYQTAQKQLADFTWSFLARLFDYDK